jgi:hypothetical protein
MAQFLCGKKFQTVAGVADLAVVVEEILASKDRVVLPGIQGIS